VSPSTTAAAPEGPLDSDSPADDGLLRVAPASALRSRGRRRSFLAWLASGTHAEPRPSSMELLEDPEPGKAGICCSGGGIRSAAFNLGALQALQSKRALSEAKYLSAVSGGSYIAAAFCMVAKTEDPEAPSGDDSNRQLLDEAAPSRPTRPRSSTSATGARTWPRTAWASSSSRSASSWG
jgi:hypothetical protein